MYINQCVTGRRRCSDMCRKGRPIDRGEQVLLRVVGDDKDLEKKRILPDRHDHAIS